MRATAPLHTPPTIARGRCVGAHRAPVGRCFRNSAPFYPHTPYGCRCGARPLTPPTHRPPPLRYTKVHKKQGLRKGGKPPPCFLLLSRRWRSPPCSSVRFPFRKRGATAKRPCGSFAVCGAKSPHVFFFLLPLSPRPFPVGKGGARKR
jgi:hypothetical protein